jgi:hypothetical protein
MTKAMELGITEFPYKELDERGTMLYWEDHAGNWSKWVYDDSGNMAFYEDSDEYWEKRKYDDSGNLLYLENSDGRIWRK